jgi:hypothetical protein
MTTSNVPEEVRRFLLGAIPSVPHLEALLLLHADPARGWDAAGLAERLYLDAGRAAQVLTDLARAGLACATADRFRFAPTEASLLSVVDATARTYGRHLVEVAELIHAARDHKAQRFADAFRLRKDS